MDRVIDGPVERDRLTWDGPLGQDTADRVVVSLRFWGHVLDVTKSLNVEDCGLIADGQTSNAISHLEIRPGLGPCFQGVVFG
jgi:hypothetical protein